MLARCAFFYMILLALSTSVFAQNTNQATPSFSCSGHLLSTEATICSDDDLKKLDRQLAIAYEGKLGTLPLSERTELRDSEKAWVAKRNQCGAHKPCIQDAYATRLTVLGGPSSLGVPSSSGTTKSS
jgi:uncharacterized protein